MQLGYNDKKSPDNILQSLQLYSGKYNFTRNLVDNTTEKSKQPYISLYTYQQFKNKQSIYIHSNLNYSENYFHRFYKETSKDSNVNTISSTVNENYLNTMTNMNYTKSFTKERELTVQFANFYHNTKSKYEGANINNEKLLTSESLGFLHFSKKWSKLFLLLRLGGSYLYYKQNDIESKNYYSFRPSVIAKYDLNSKNSIQYRGSWDNSFPTLSLMSDVVQPIDFLQKRKGNPDLKIMKLLSNSLTYSYLSDFFNANISLEYYNFSPTIKNTVYYNGFHFIHSYESNGSYQMITPGIGLTLKLFENKLNFKVNSGLNRYIITGITNDQHTNWYINPSVQFFYKDFSINAFYYSPRKGISNSLNFWGNSERYGLYVSYNKKGISLTIGTQNPFSIYSKTNQKTFDVYSAQTIKYNSQNDHLLYLTFSYNFSFGRDYKYSKINSDSPSNSAIVKGLKD